MTSPGDAREPDPQPDAPAVNPGESSGDRSEPVVEQDAPRTAATSSTSSTASTAAPAETPAPWWQFWRRRSADDDEPPPKKKSLAREIPVLIIIALALALLIKTFVVQPFYIPSGSMEQTLKINDRVLVNKMIYHFRDVKRGEIVVFNIKGTGFAPFATPLAPPSNIVSRAFRNLESLFGLGPNNSDFIKRVIGIGGDTVACCDAQGRVTVNGKALNEPYVYRDGPDEANKQFNPVKVPKGDLFVMGDHRNDSEDSRVAGPFPQSKVIGQAFVRVWPITKWRGFGVPKTFSQLTAEGGPTVGALLPLWWIGSKRRRRSWRLPVLTGPPGREAD
jgi:signal peptidase I